MTISASGVKRMSNREQIIENLKHIKSAIEWDNSLDYQLMLDEAIDYIKNSVKQKHGLFIQNEFVSTLGICSECENPIDDGDNYCKWCGAKMKEVTEDDG